MRNIVIINGYPHSTIVTSPSPSLHHHNHFLSHKKPPFLLLSLHNPHFNSLSKPISLTSLPSSSFTQTKIHLSFYGSNIIENGSSSSTLDGFLGSKVVVLGGNALRLLFMEFFQTLAGLKFSIEDLTKPSDSVETSIDKHSSRLALRKQVHNDSRRVGDRASKEVDIVNRRRVLLSSVGSIAFCLLNTASFSAAPLALAASSRADYADMPALRGKDYGKTKMRYPDYIETETGLQFKDLRIGTGPTPNIGDTVVVDWDGYTIGYYGRIFEARNKTKGGSFEGDDKAFFKFRLGSQEVIPAFEEAIVGMSLGGVRRIIVPPELGYPGNDYNQKGPRPTTFSGQRALDFVLRNQGLIDKTLLFDIELLKIIPNGSSF